MSGKATWTCNVCGMDEILPIENAPEKWVRASSITYRPYRHPAGTPLPRGGFFLEKDIPSKELPITLHICDTCFKKLQALKDWDSVRLVLGDVKKPKKRKKKISKVTSVNNTEYKPIELKDVDVSVKEERQAEYACKGE
jgi:hypothetical protein